MYCVTTTGTCTSDRGVPEIKGFSGAVSDRFRPYDRQAKTAAEAKSKAFEEDVQVRSEDKIRELKLQMDSERSQWEEEKKELESHGAELESNLKRLQEAVSRRTVSLAVESREAAEAACKVNEGLLGELKATQTQLTRAENDTVDLKTLLDKSNAEIDNLQNQLKDQTKKTAKLQEMVTSLPEFPPLIIL